MQREVIKWLQTLELSSTVQNPKRDLATGHAAAEIVCHYTGTKYIDLQRLPSGAAGTTKRDIWLQVFNALQKLKCIAVTPQLVDAVLRREPNAALTVLECLYEHFTGHTLPMRGLDAVGTTRNAYVQPANAASTANLLAVANGDGVLGDKGKTLTLYDPPGTTDGTSSLRGAAADMAAAEKNRTLTDVTQSDGKKNKPAADVPPSLDHATVAAPVLQQRLALIDNDELAGGANALQAYPRYARPTASTLVHAASGVRKDVVLDRPKYTADETRQRAQNIRITQQHAVVQRMQEGRGGEANNNASGDTQLSTQHGNGAPSSSWPAVSGASGKAVVTDATQDSLPLTLVYRGRFYREPESAAITAKSRPKGEDGKKKKKQAAGGSADAENDTSFIGGNDDEEGGDRHLGVAVGSALHTATDESFRSTSHEKAIRIGSAGNSRAVPKLRVKVHSTALKTALALRSGPGQLRDRAAALSRELFAKHQYMLRPALSEILADVLSAHKQLEHLLDCSSEDGGGEVLENVLGHLLAHRQAFPLSCIKACWETLSQHIDGIVVTLQHTPDEYSYLLESFAFAFSREAAQMPVLYPQLPTGAGAAATNIIDGYSEEASVVRDGEAPLKCGEKGESNGANHLAFSSKCSSLHDAATAATRRTSEATGSTAAAGEEDSAALPPLQLQQQSPLLPLLPPPPLPVFVNARQQMDLISAFHLLAGIARQLDVPTASYLLKRYTLRAATPFLLRGGTAAVREAVAQLVSASFMPAAPALGEEHTGSKGSATTSAKSTEAADGEANLVSFLTSDLVASARATLHPASAARLHSLSTREGAAGGTAKTGGKQRERRLLPNIGDHRVSTTVQRQQAYWHVLSHIAADFAAGSQTNNEVLLPAADGPLARCALASAMTCLDSSDVTVRTAGVWLVMECCERWWEQAWNGEVGDEEVRADENGNRRGSIGFTRNTLYILLSRVLVSLSEAGDDGDGETKGAPLSDHASMTAAWWNTRAVGTWELRLTVLRLCVSLLTHAPGNAANRCNSNSNGSRVYRAADAAAAVCLSTFAAGTFTEGTTTFATAQQAVPLWQAQLALGLAGRVVDPARTPSLTAGWWHLLHLCARLTSSFNTTASGGTGGSSFVIPSDGIATYLLLAPLQFFGGVQAFLPYKPLPLCPSSLSGTAVAAGTAAAVLSGQRKESLLSASRPIKTHTDSHPVTAAGGGRASVVSNRTQRNTTQTQLDDTATSLFSSLERNTNNTTLQLVCAHVQSVYAVMPLYQTWNTRGVMDALLKLYPSTTTAMLAESGGRVGDASLHLQLVTAGIASSALHPGDDDDEFWHCVMLHIWPLLEAHKPTREALAAFSAHPPAAVQTNHFEDSRSEVVAVLVVALFLRCAGETAVASAVAAAAEDWRVLCDSALSWAEAAVGNADQAY